MNKNLGAVTKKLIDKIYNRADLFIKDNIKNPSQKDYTLIHSAILIGSQIGIEWELNNVGSLDKNSFVYADLKCFR
jgi:hypothetical protein